MRREHIWAGVYLFAWMEENTPRLKLEAQPAKSFQIVFYDAR